MKSYAERIIGTYKDGKKDGEWIKLSATGEVIQKQRWNLGNFIGLVP
jgi:antitoxin component YwqK of YwqJK toxin-antitoxin module